MKSFFKIKLTTFVIGCVLISCSEDDNRPAQQIIPESNLLEFSNGPISTGTTAALGTVAPTDYTWSEVQLNNKNAGFSASQGNYALADDFKIPDGETWDISKISFLMYQSDYSGGSNPLESLAFEIFDTNPGTVGTLPVYGNMIDNKLTGGESSRVYRIVKETANSPTAFTRKVFKVTCDISDLSLPPGTYWIVWSSKTISDVAHFYPPVTIVNQLNSTGSNAMRYRFGLNTWENVQDEDSNAVQDFPFAISGTIKND